MSRRDFLAIGGLGGAAVLGGLVAAAATPVRAASSDLAAAGPLPPGAPLRVTPLLAYAIAQPREKTSWRSYGGLKSREDVDAEAKRIEQELRALAAGAEFPIQMAPLQLVGSDAEAAAVAATDTDALLVFASGGPQHWLEKLAASGKPNILFVRHRSGPVYLWYEIAHWRLLRKSEDAMAEPNMTVDDVVVDEYADVLWRLRALYGLKNTKGTKCLAIGGLQAYSKPGTERGPEQAKQRWGLEIIPVSDADLVQRLQKARDDAAVMQQAEQQTAALLSSANVALETERRFVVTSFVVLRVFQDLLKETGAANLGVANCMGALIRTIDTTPCLVLSLLNDAGFTAFCHTDYTHTPAGVLLRWISGKPSFVCNSHFPHHGMITLAHCSAPRKMNGKDLEPTKLMTHFESDYGAATKVEYSKDQPVTCIVPNLNCTKWYGFKGQIMASPAMDMCRSQMDVAIQGDWKRLLHELEGFHTIVTYGNYLREVGYALGKVGLGWANYSEDA